MERLIAIIDDEKIIIDGVPRNIPNLKNEYAELHAIQYSSGEIEKEWKSGENDIEFDEGLIDDLYQKWVDHEVIVVFHKETGEIKELFKKDDLPENYQETIPFHVELDQEYSKAMNRIKTKYENEFEDILKKYPSVEIYGWDMQLKAVEKFEESGHSDFLESLAMPRNLSQEQMAERIKTKSKEFENKYSHITSKLGKLRDDLQTLFEESNLEEIKEFDWNGEE